MFNSIFTLFKTIPSLKEKREEASLLLKLAFFVLCNDEKFNKSILFMENYERLRRGKDLAWGWYTQRKTGLVPNDKYIVVLLQLIKLNSGITFYITKKEKEILERMNSRFSIDYNITLMDELFSKRLYYMEEYFSDSHPVMDTGRRMKFGMNFS